MRDRWLLAFTVGALVFGIAFTIWFATTCAATHGGHWWCWLG